MTKSITHLLTPNTKTTTPMHTQIQHIFQEYSNHLRYPIIPDWYQCVNNLKDENNMESDLTE